MSNATTHIEIEKRSAERSRSKLVPALRFKEFDGEWDLKRLASSIEIVAGYAFKSTEMENTPSTYQIIKMSNVYKSKLQLDRSPSYWEKIDKKQAKFLLRKKDILLTLTGTVGKKDYGYSIVIPENNKFLLNQRLVYLRYIENVSDGDFINNLIKTSRFFYFFFNESKGGTGNQTNVGIEDLKNIKLSFPALPEQQKIASFLSAVDEKIQQLTKKKALLEQYKKGLMQQLFSGQLRFKNENGNPYPNWEEKRLGEVFGVIRGKGISKDQLNDNGETKCILYGQLYTTYNEVVFNVVSRTDTNEGVLSIKGDLLVPSSTTTTGIDLANVTALNEEGVLLGGDISILRSKLDANNVFYAYYLSNHKKYEIAAFAQGSTIVHLSYNHFKVMRIDIPVIEEQQKIATYLSRIDTKIEAVNNQITQTQTFKKGLLQQMFV
jgi:type I restriction enzyme S subunit